ncbi:Phosphoglycerate kinase [Glycine max]|nr:Phosphoglycerate kinase [Glycine max]
MNILSYNIRGLGRGIKWASIRKLVGKHQVDVLCLQETKRDSLSKEDCQVLWGHSDVAWEWQPGENTAGGLLCIWDNNNFQRECDEKNQSVSNVVYTIKYLPKAGAKVILVSDWNMNNLELQNFLSEVLQIQVVPLHGISFNKLSKMNGLEKENIHLLENLSNIKEEVANCVEFARVLSSGVDIFVNYSFSNSHKVLASTVGVTRFWYACIAGFYFEERLCLLKNLAEASRKPYVAIIGGGNLYDKAASFQFLASRCQWFVFVGMMPFQVMHALGVSVPRNLVDHKAFNEALDTVRLTRDRNMQILYPKDFWCRKKCDPKQLQVPVDLGPVSLDEICSMLANCKKIIWIGPVKFADSSKYTNEASKLTRILEQLSQNNCEIAVVGTMASKLVRQEKSSLSLINIVENASVVWEFLKGRKLPVTFCWDTLLKSTGTEFTLTQLNLWYCIATNATSTFHSIVSSYPGELVLVSIQCPNPDFNKPEHRWRMLQRSLIEAVVDLLAPNGKIFLQSDVEAVAIRMKEQFLTYGKGKLDMEHGQSEWLEENPFGLDQIGKGMF